MTNFGMATELGEEACFYIFSHTSVMSHVGRAPASPYYLGPLTCTHTVQETATKFLLVIKLDVRKIFTGQPRMLMHNLFTVANLLVAIFLSAHASFYSCNLQKLEGTLLTCF